MLSRRDLVGKLAAGAAGVVVLGAAAKRTLGAVPSNRAQEPSQANDAVIGDVPSVAEATQEAAAPEAVSVAPPAAPPPWELLRPLALGAVVAHGWRVADLSGPADGACVLTLQNERGRVQRVHLCRNNGRPQGFVYTQQFDLVVMNGGQGDLGTEENLAHAVAAVSHVIAANEGGANHAVTAALLPHGDRVQQFSDTNEWTLR